MLNRLGLVIHWMGFTFACLIFLLTVALLGGGLYDVIKLRAEIPLLEIDLELKKKQNEDFEALITEELGSRELTELELIVRSGKRLDLERESRKAETDLEELNDRTGNQLWQYVLGLLFSPLLIFLIMLPAWATRFILTGEKVFFPWRSADV